MTTLEALTRRPVHAPALPHVVAGSWVHGTLATWMGDSDKNAAWDLLCDAKLAYDRITADGRITAPRRAALERQLALCESSDWFWWFGDYNPADAVAQFDRLFRRQLTTLYRLLELDAPAALSLPVASAGAVGERAMPEHGGVMRRAHG